MAKCSDYNKIWNIAHHYLMDNKCQILDFFPIDVAARIFTMIYLTNVYTGEFTQSFKDNLSITTGSNYVCIHYHGMNASYKKSGLLCSYISIDADMKSLGDAFDELLKDFGNL